MEKIIKELESLKLSNTGFRAGSYNEGINAALHLIKSSLPKPVEVPEFVAEWIEHVKALHWRIEDVFSPEASSHSVAPLVEEWLTKENAELIARAWLDGYTVVKEPLYWIYDPIADQYLGYDRAEGKVWWLIKQNNGARAELTDAEITNIGEQYRAFAVPVEEE